MTYSQKVTINYRHLIKNKEDFGLFDTFQCTISDLQLTIYDLNGRKIETDDLRELEKGIYIVNGKKVMIK